MLHSLVLGLLSHWQSESCIFQGLVVPVIRDADTMNFADIEKGINNLAKKATEGALSIDEMAGGTFTISNGGVYGSLISTPIINPPQVLLPFFSGAQLNLLKQHSIADIHPKHNSLSIFAVSDSWDALHRATPRGRGRQHPRQAHDVPRADIRPQADRRQRSRLLPAPHQGRRRGPAEAAP